jgi:hypothetical protein
VLKIEPSGRVHSNSYTLLVKIPAHMYDNKHFSNHKYKITYESQGKPAYNAADSEFETNKLRNLFFILSLKFIY